MLCFRKFLVAKKFLDRREGELSRFSFENFLSPNAETFRRGTLLCCVSENFCQRKCLWIRGRGKYQDFPSNILWLAVPKHFVEELFYAVFQKFPGSKKVSGYEGGVGIKFFLRKFFVPQCRNIS